MGSIDSIPSKDTTAETTGHVWLRRFSKGVCFLTLLLIFLGGQVKSHEAGLSVPDWPLTYGENPITYPFEKWTGGIFHEHFHRLFAGVVATLTVVLAVWLQKGQPQLWLKRLGWVSVVAVLLQALLGGLTVIYQLPVAISSAHAILAQTFFVLTLIIAYGLSREFRKPAFEGRYKEIVDHLDNYPNSPETPQSAELSAEAAVPISGSSPNFTGLCVSFLIFLIFVQLFLGALMRHTEAGLAIPDFPTTAGRVVPAFNEETLAWVNHWRFEHAYYRGVDLPPVTLSQMVTHFLHRAGAVAVTLGVLLVVWQCWLQRRFTPQLYRTSLYLLALVLIQFTLGVLTVWSVKLPILTSVHVMFGAALLGMTVLLALRYWALQSHARELLRARLPHLFEHIAT